MIPPRFETVLGPTAPATLLGELFAGAGHQLYLVGGIIRDILLDRDPGPGAEMDFATDARPEQVKALVGSWADDLYTMGETFGTIGLRKDGQSLEVTTFRREVYRDESRKPVVEFSDDIETDLSRRDFTVNALALRLPDPVMVDPHGGLADLERRVLRTPLQPEVSFGDDPLRMLRLFRFVASHGFVADPVAADAATEMRDRLEIVSAERIRDELSKLLLGEWVTEGLEGLVGSRLAEVFLPELPALALEQDPLHRHKDVLAHTIAVTAKTPPDLVLRLAALFHDVGKPATRRIEPMGVSFHHHEVVGQRMTVERLRALRYPKDVVDAVARLVYLHMRPHTLKMGWSDRAVRRYVRDAGPMLERLNTLVRCDVTTRNERRARAIDRRIDELEERIADLRSREEIDRIRPPIDGHQVMAHLGLSPGPVVGEAMDMLLEHRLDEGPYSEEEALRLLDEWWAARAG